MIQTQRTMKFRCQSILILLSWEVVMSFKMPMSTLHLHSSTNAISSIPTPSTNIQHKKNNRKENNEEEYDEMTVTGANLKYWRKGFTSCVKEISPTVIPMDLPYDFPIGTYYRNGHGKYEADDGEKVVHMLDADGLVVSVTFDPPSKPSTSPTNNSKQTTSNSSGRILFRNKFVRTEGYIKDKRFGKMTFRGLFGTKRSSTLPFGKQELQFLDNMFRTKVKNAANTNVLYAGGKAHALWEVGKPFELDPYTLDTLSLPRGNNMNGILTKYDAFGAHPKYDPTSNRYVNFGNSYNPVTGKTKTRLFELDENFKSVNSDEVSFLYDGPSLVHDFCVTDSWHLFLLNSAKIDSTKLLHALLGTGSMMNAIMTTDGTNGDTNTTMVVLVPRRKHLKGPAFNMDLKDPRIKVIPIPGHFNFHFANAFEDECGNIIFDSVEQDQDAFGLNNDFSVPIWESDSYFDSIEPSKLVRHSLDLTFNCLSPAGGCNIDSSSSISYNCSPQTILNSRAPEFPSIPSDLSTRQHRFIYCVGGHKEITKPKMENPNKKLGTGPPGSVIKVDSQDPSKSYVYEYEPHEFPGEVTFVAKVGSNVTDPSQEDRGYLIHFLTNGRDMTTDIVILDAEGSNLRKGPISRTTLPTFIGHGLHGSFAKGITFPCNQDEEIEHLKIV